MAVYCYLAKALGSKVQWHKNLFVTSNDKQGEVSLKASSLPLKGGSMRQVRFNELPITDKALLVAEFGNFLQSIEFYDYRVHLYSLNSHFIEVYYNILTRQVERISLADYNELDKYLSRIILPSLKK